jgi:hypothetical protein
VAAQRTGMEGRSDHGMKMHEEDEAVTGRTIGGPNLLVLI